MSDELHPAASDQTRGVRQSLAQIRSLTGDATERLMVSLLGHESEDQTQARLGLRRFVEDTAGVLGEVLELLESGAAPDRLRDTVRTRVSDLARRSGIAVDAEELGTEHVEDLGAKMGESVATVVQSLQMEDLVNQLADEIQRRLDRLDELSAEVRDTARHLQTADPDEVRRFAERLVELSEAISRMREEWSDGHRSVTQQQMDQGEIELF